MRAIGKIPLDVAGDFPECRELRRELDVFPAAGSSDGALRFVFGENSSRCGPRVRIGSVSVYPEANVMGVPVGMYQTADVPLTPGGPDGPITIRRTAARPRGFSKTVRRFRDWNYLTDAEVRAKDAFYGVIDPAVFLSALRNDTAYVHASAVATDGGAFLFGGWGGSGKTSIASLLALREGFKFVADDLTPIDSAGTVYPYPKKLQVYGYNTAGEPRLSRLLYARMSPLERLQWHLRLRLKGPERVRRRVNPADIYGATAISTRAAPLRAIWFLERTDAPAIKSRPAGAAELAERLANVIAKEFNDTLMNLYAYRSGGGSAPHPAELLGRYRETYYEAFRGAQTAIVSVPVNTRPSGLLRFFTAASEGPFGSEQGGGAEG
jgi:hypothetical protein